MSTQPPKDTTTLTFFGGKTVNGLKVLIALEELIAAGSPMTYTAHNINFMKNEQNEPWFLAINPNAKIPTIVDNARDEFVMYESAAILDYLRKHYDPAGVLGFEDDNEDSECMLWTQFQMANLGPMQGQATHFVFAAPMMNGTKDVYAAQRYIAETKRIYAVYEQRLAGGREYLVGAGKGRYSAADMLTFPWLRVRGFSIGMTSLAEGGFPLLDAYEKRIEARPAVKKAIAGDMVDNLMQNAEWEAITKKRLEWIYPAADEQSKEAA